MEYLHWDEQTITDFSDQAVADMYARGYVFTRIGKGVMHQTRSARIDLSKFELSSENRRIIKKVSDIALTVKKTPLAEYDWKLGKLAKDFYETKFGPGIMSAQKIKEMLTDASASNFNATLVYEKDAIPLGYVIAYQTAAILHYSYPFYDLATAPKDMGLGMMNLALHYAKEAGLRYVYLGSLQRATDTYKLQFSSLEWFDGGPSGTGAWRSDHEGIKKDLREKAF